MAGKLKPLDIQREEKPGKYADGDGLYLIVVGPTSKNWSYRYWFKVRNDGMALVPSKMFRLRRLASPVTRPGSRFVPASTPCTRWRSRKSSRAISMIC